MKRHKLATPCCLFLYNPFNLEKRDENIIIDTLQGAQNLNKLPETIYKSLSNKENTRFSPSNNVINKNTKENKYPEQDYYYGDYDFEDDSHGSLINKQKEELSRLEREEEEKNRKLILDKQLKIQKEKEEKELEDRKLKEETQRKNILLYKKRNLPVEPVSTDPNSTHILFRYPDDSGRRSERRFYKQDTIKDLYNFVESLEDVEFNKEGKFELIQTFPFAVFTDKEKTLEEEKLFPNAVLQIREKN